MAAPIFLRPATLYLLPAKCATSLNRSRIALPGAESPVSPRSLQLGFEALAGLLVRRAWLRGLGGGKLAVHQVAVEQEDLALGLRERVVLQFGRGDDRVGEPEGDQDLLDEVEQPPDHDDVFLAEALELGSQHHAFLGDGPEDLLRGAPIGLVQAGGRGASGGGSWPRAATASTRGRSRCISSVGRALRSQCRGPAHRLPAGDDPALLRHAGQRVPRSSPAGCASMPRRRTAQGPPRDGSPRSASCRPFWKQADPSAAQPRPEAARRLRGRRSSTIPTCSSSTSRRRASTPTRSIERARADPQLRRVTRRSCSRRTSFRKSMRMCAPRRAHQPGPHRGRYDRRRTRAGARRPRDRLPRADRRCRGRPGSDRAPRAGTPAPQAVGETEPEADRWVSVAALMLQGTASQMFLSPIAYAFLDGVHVLRAPSSSSASSSSRTRQSTALELLRVGCRSPSRSSFPAS